MKLALDAKRLFFNTTGLGNYSCTLVQNLLQYSGAAMPELHLYSPNKSAKEFPFVAANSLEVHYGHGVSKSFWRSQGIVKDLKAHKIDCYHGLSNEIPIGLQKQHIASTVTIHDLIFKIYPKTYSFSERLVYDKKFYYAAQNAQKVIAISQQTKQDLVKFYGVEASKIEVIYQACNPIFYQLQDVNLLNIVRQKYQLPERFFLYVGSIVERKNLMLLLEAYAHQAKLRSVPIVVVGKGTAYEKKCKAYAQEKGLTDSLRWLHNLEQNSELQAFYQLATALIYPSLYEGFGLPLAEALLSKCPVIAAKTSSLPEAGGINSIYIDPHNSAALADILLQFVAETIDTKLMTQKGYDYALQTFDPKLLNSQLLKHYNSL